MEPIRVNWLELKDFAVSRKINIQYLDMNTAYVLYAIDGSFALQCSISKKDPTPPGSDQEDFEINYQDSCNDPIEPKTLDKKKYIHQTSRPLGTFTYFSGAGDDQSDPTKIGGEVTEEEKLKLHLPVGTMSKTVYMDLNMVVNKTHIHEGYLQWLGALNDDITMTLVPKLTSYSAGSNTNYNLYNGYLVIPAAGDGEIVVGTEDIELVQCVPDEKGDVQPGYWSADFNEETKQFEDITAAPLGDGGYNIFGAEAPLFRFANKIPALGEGFIMLQTADQSRIGHGMRIKIKADTCGNGHEWFCNAFITFHREKTC